MVNNAHNFESIIYIYVCHNQHLIKLVDDDFFKGQFVSKLYKLTKSFYKNFKTIPFKLDNPSVEQIEQISHRSAKLISTDKNKTEEENVSIFVNNVEHIIRTNIKGYDPKWLSETIEAWIQWENSQKGYRLAIEYQKSVELTPENVKDVISKSREILISRNSISIDEDNGVDFEDPDAHKQTLSTNFVNTGFSNFNKMVCGNPNGGVEPGTLNMFVGDPNSGKSIFLAAIGYNAYINGHNVLAISLEMSVQKIIKRVGANAFDIPIDRYNDFSYDSTKVISEIKKMKDRHNPDLKTPVGKYRLKRFSSASAVDIEAFAKRISQELGIQWHMIVIDYFTEMDNHEGISSDRSYYYHKSNAKALFKMAVNNNWAVLTAHQLKQAAFGNESRDINMGSLGESSGINHSLDNLRAIVQTPDMRRDRQYEIKCLKPRDGEFKNYRIPFCIDYSKMRLVENGEMLHPDESSGYI